MPSPLAHGATGYLIYRISQIGKRTDSDKESATISWLAIRTVGLSLVPDLDVIPGLLLGDLGRFHNNLTHSLFVGVLVALGLGAAVWTVKHSGFRKWFALALVSYELHILMDFVSVGGRGLMLAWPFLSVRFISPITLFYGVRWSGGLIDPRHLLTLLTELGYLGIVWLVTHRIKQR